MSINYLGGFYPRAKVQDKYVYVQHEFKNVENVKLMQINLREFYPQAFQRNKFVFMQLEVADEISSGFTTFNLKHHYHDAIVEECNLVTVINEVADELLADKQYQNTYFCSMRHNDVLSLDVADGILDEASYTIKSGCPDVLIEAKARRCMLCQALNSLPEIQGRRIEAHYLLRQSKRKIALSENVNEASVNVSIRRGLTSMKNFSINFRK
ncbi:MAG: hypothetical protein FWD05_07240 [Oscillospiraceae bacterium]|nr:hypothetical protein [Oscillospiraceae bacterium]